MTNPIWKSAELECWARGFDYENYCYWCKEVASISPVSEHFYKRLCDLFYANMKQDLEETKDEDGET